MRVRDEKIVNKVFVFDFRCRTSAPTAFLCLVNINRLGFGVAAVRQRDHDFLARDQVLNTEVAVILDNFRAPLIAKCLANLRELIANDLQQPVRISQNTRKFFNFPQYLFVFAYYFFLF